MNLVGAQTYWAEPYEAHGVIVKTDGRDDDVLVGVIVKSDAPENPWFIFAFGEDDPEPDVFFASTYEQALSHLVPQPSPEHERSLRERRQISG